MTVSIIVNNPDKRPWFLAEFSLSLEIERRAITHLVKAEIMRHRRGSIASFCMSLSL